ncbi:MAG TPA: MFS transporter [Miltoncostaeaceae bacterium]|nr:MFS transporter [Miltoncostaeaceae bacterium]
MTRASWLACLTLLIFTMGTSIVTPLLPLYQDRFDLSDGQVTLLFATYTATVVPTMLLSGNLSDRFGRKAVMLPAMVSISLASLLLAWAEAVPLLFLGRVFQGLAIGGFLGVGTALIVDHARASSRATASVIAGLVFRLGFGLGPGMAGLIAEYAGNPLHAPFQVHLALMIVAFAAIAFTPETVGRRAATPPPPAPLNARRGRIGVGVPPGQFAGFALFLAPAAFMVGYLDATLLSVVPLYMVRVLDVQNLALIGLVGFLILGTGGLTPVVARRVPPRASVVAGVLGGAVGSLLVVSAAGLDSALVVVVAAAVIGFLNGLILKGGTAICGVSVPISERGKLMSALYMCAYAGTLPTIGLGYLSGAVGVTAALGAFSVLALAIALFVVTVGARAFRQVIPHREPDPAVAIAGPGV